MPSDRPAPCPFCGGLSQAVPSLSPPSSVTCTRCRARIDADDIGTAIERWNRRAPVPSDDRESEACVKCGRARSNHNVRHPFVGMRDDD